jgi:hypothetical protein
MSYYVQIIHIQEIEPDGFRAETLPQAYPTVGSAAVAGQAHVEKKPSGTVTFKIVDENGDPAE